MAEQQNFSEWIGLKHTPQTDIITPRLVNSFAATFGEHLAEGAHVPLGLHWCLSPPTAPADHLGPDGHPAKGGFLPPIFLPRRMWASGEVHFLAPLQAGVVVKKSSEIKSITSKDGRSGPLCFVTVENTYTTEGNVAVRETQNIVYREAATEFAPISEPKADEGAFDAVRIVEITPVMLFRYSALTFNAHRIHYDLPYTQQTEFYPDLVIHGPLQATLLLNLAASLEEGLPRRFAFKGVVPATGAQDLQLGAKRTDGNIDLSVHTANGSKTMDAVAKW